MTNTTAVKDPVCGMEIDLLNAAGRTEHNQQTYYFCSPSCQQKFSANPAQYMDTCLSMPTGGYV